MNTIIAQIKKDMKEQWGDLHIGFFNNVRYQLRWKSDLLDMAQEFFGIVTVKGNKCKCRISDELIPKGQKALRIKFYTSNQQTAYISFKALKQYGAWDKMLKNMKELEKEMKKISLEPNELLTKTETERELEMITEQSNKIAW